MFRTVSIGDMVQEKIQEKYTFEKLIGEGAFGSVRIAHLKADKSKKFAIKSMKRCKFDTGATGGEDDKDDHHDHDHGAEDSKMMQQYL